ncbi:MAG: type IX secretion system membrane protein PorP/SprF [Cryomorphaceae bacterium]|nr:MAG: type IX secretion system membrane protein PorP/SprF [Cryomorphaceae bacterium]
MELQKIAHLSDMLRRYLPVALVTVVLTVFWQEEGKAQDPQFSQFYANPLYLNPAFAGSARCPRLVMNYRNQWPAISGNFVTYSASYDQHVDPLSGGLGLLVTNDVAGTGTLTNTRISGIYSYQRPISKTWSIKAGFEVTYFNKSLDWNKLKFGDQIDTRQGFIYATQDIPRGGTVSNIDFSSGLLLFNETYFFGFATHHLTQPNESLIVGTSRLPRRWTAHAGATYPVGGRDSDVTLSPNILYMVQGDFQQLNLGMYVNKYPFVLGAWYRWEDALIIMLGVQTNSIRFGYSYDLTLNRLGIGTGGSHEISAAYQFNCKPAKRKFRVINCPSF